MSRAADVQVDDQAQNLVYSPSSAWQQTTGNQQAFDGTLSSTSTGNVTVAFQGASDVTVQCLFVPQPLAFNIILDGNLLGTLVANSTALSLNGGSTSQPCAEIPGIPNPEQQHTLILQVLPSSSIDTQQSTFSLDSFTFSPNTTNSSSSTTTTSSPLPTASNSSNNSTSSSSKAGGVSKGAIIFSGVVAGIVATGIACCIFFFVRKRRRSRKDRSPSPSLIQGDKPFGGWTFQNSETGAGGGSISIPPKSPHYIPNSAIRASMAGTPFISQPLPSSSLNTISYVPQPPRQAPSPPVLYGTTTGTPSASPLSFSSFPMPPPIATNDPLPARTARDLPSIPTSLRSGYMSPGHSSHPSLSSENWV